MRVTSIRAARPNCRETRPPTQDRASAIEAIVARAGRRRQAAAIRFLAIALLATAALTVTVLIEPIAPPHAAPHPRISAHPIN